MSAPRLPAIQHIWASEEAARTYLVGNQKSDLESTWALPQSAAVRAYCRQVLINIQKKVVLYVLYGGLKSWKSLVNNSVFFYTGIWYRLSWRAKQNALSLFNDNIDKSCRNNTKPILDGYRQQRQYKRSYSLKKTNYKYSHSDMNMHMNHKCKFCIVKANHSSDTMAM